MAPFWQRHARDRALAGADQAAAGVCADLLSGGAAEREISRSRAARHRSPRRLGKPASEGAHMAPIEPSPGRDDLEPHWNWGRALPAPGRHGRRLRDPGRFPPPAALPPGARPRGAAQLRMRRPAAVRRQQHPLRQRHQDRRMGARQVLPLRAADRGRRADRLGLRLGRGPPPALLRLARPGRTAGPACSACAARSRRASA